MSGEPMQGGQRLFNSVGGLTAAGADGLLRPLRDAMDALKGIDSKIVTGIDFDKIRSALTEAKGQELQALIGERLESSYQRALTLIGVYRDLLTGVTADIDLANIKALMGDRFVGPDAKIFAGQNLGPITPVPAGLLEWLSVECDLAKDGRKRLQTYCVTYLPELLDGAPHTIELLIDFASRVDRKGPPIFEDPGRFAEMPTVEQPIGRGVWVTEYADVCPGTLGRTEHQQDNVVSAFKDIRTAKFHEHVGTMVVQSLENQHRIYQGVWGRCEEQWPASRPMVDRLSAGRCVADGPISDHSIFGGPGYLNVGRAVVRK